MIFKKKTHYDEEQREFMDAVDKLAKKFGYKRTLFAENDGRERVVQFTPLSGKEWSDNNPIVIYKE
jgi:hypothetical protein